MALDKAIKSGKEHRKPYYRSERFDWTCRPNGGCPYCADNRQHKHRRAAAKVDPKWDRDFNPNIMKGN